MARFNCTNTPTDMVRLTCTKCGRAGQYRMQSLIARYGADIRLPDLREEIARCGRHSKMHDACTLRYVGSKTEMKRPHSLPMRLLSFTPIFKSTDRQLAADGP
jgi:hypothetical protein